jgi:ApaG protein
MSEPEVGSDTLTRGVRVRARATYEPERSSPREGSWFFSYRIEIENVGERTVQLLSRRWQITDGRNEVRVVEGPGVVGETPLLAPGESFEYTSFCPLPTPIGTMEGHYVMVDAASGERFLARIDPFLLAAPGSVH